MVDLGILKPEFIDNFVGTLITSVEHPCPYVSFGLFCEKGMSRDDANRIDLAVTCNSKLDSNITFDASLPCKRVIHRRFQMTGADALGHLAPR